MKAGKRFRIIGRAGSAQLTPFLLALSLTGIATAQMWEIPNPQKRRFPDGNPDADYQCSGSTDVRKSGNETAS